MIKMKITKGLLLFKDTNKREYIFLTKSMINKIEIIHKTDMISKIEFIETKDMRGIISMIDMTDMIDRIAVIDKNRITIDIIVQEVLWGSIIIIIEENTLMIIGDLTNTETIIFIEITEVIMKNNLNWDTIDMIMMILRTEREKYRWKLEKLKKMGD